MSIPHYRDLASHIAAIPSFLRNNGGGAYLSLGAWRSFHKRGTAASSVCVYSERG